MGGLLRLLYIVFIYFSSFPPSSSISRVATAFKHCVIIGCRLKKARNGQQTYYRPFL